MRHHNELTGDQRAAIADAITCRPSDAMRIKGLAAKSISLGSSLPVWTLASPPTSSADLAHITKDTNQWYTLIHHDGQPVEFALTTGPQIPGERHSLNGIFTSSAAKGVDHAIGVISRTHPQITNLRLLWLPSHHVHALWYIANEDHFVVVASTSRNAKGHIECHRPYKSSDFVAALSKLDRGQRIPRFATRRRDKFLTRIRKSSRTVAWGVYTLLLVACVIGCGIEISRTAPNHVDLRRAFIELEVALFVAYCCIGKLSRNRVDGILVDNLNRMSLSKLQSLVWASVLGGAYYTACLWDITHAAGLPTLSPDLLKVIGVVATAPVVRNVINDGKMNAPSIPGPSAQSSFNGLPAPVAPGGTPRQIGALDANANASEASWADLYLGEEVANRNVVDVSRIQKLVFTIILVASFVALVCQQFGDVQITTSPGHPAIGAVLPSIDSSFVWLLGFSNAAYLAAKATPKSPFSP